MVWMKATYLDKNYPRKMKDSERLELIFFFVRKRTVIS